MLVCVCVWFPFGADWVTIEEFPLEPLTSTGSSLTQRSLTFPRIPSVSSITLRTVIIFFFFSISSRHPVQTEHTHRMWVLHRNTWFNDANVLNFQTVVLFMSNSDIGENCSLVYCINAEVDFGRYFKAARFV